MFKNQILNVFQYIFNLLFLLAFLADNFFLSADAEPTPPKIGNFSLPSSQQPAALVSFGGNILDKSEIQLGGFADTFRGSTKAATEVVPEILFGITSDWSIYFTFPFAASWTDHCYSSTGMEDFCVQLEYAFYNKSTLTYVDQATIVTNITLPTGSVHKKPPTGFGSPSFFIGATYYHTMQDWFLFTSPGVVLTTSEHGTKFGDQLLYQFGFGRNFPSPEGWVYAWMVEVDGQYNKKNRIRGGIDSNSGGNLIYLTPSLWMSTKELILQLGISVPVNRNFFGHQQGFDYALTFNLTWSFY